jgi:hypothetical protein
VRLIKKHISTFCSVSVMLGYIHRNAPGPERQPIDAENSQTHDIFPTITSS